MTNQDVGTRLADLAGTTAELLIKKLGSFPPFGLALDKEHQKVLVTKSEDGKTLLTLETVPLRLRDEAAGGRFLGTAVVALLQMASSPNETQLDTIAIQIEVQGAEIVVLGSTFKKGIFGYKFSEPFAIGHQIAERVFA